jgi:hypothetical protein
MHPNLLPTDGGRANQQRGSRGCLKGRSAIRDGRVGVYIAVSQLGPVPAVRKELPLAAAAVVKVHGTHAAQAGRQLEGPAAGQRVEVVVFNGGAVLAVADALAVEEVGRAGDQHVDRVPGRREEPRGAPDDVEV